MQVEDESWDIELRSLGPGFSILVVMGSEEEFGRVRRIWESG